jgi:hypothetical protein
VHLSSAEQMEMQMVDRLPTFGSRADHHAITLPQPLLARDVGRG